MSELCNVLMPEVKPLMANLTAVCARPPGHEGDHCSVLHKPFGQQDCPRCAPTRSESPRGNETRNE